ncbi:twin-arginine translocase subunit TatC [Candidatus Saccharibacteria bacterium]|nr:twin-arginine translocase subunit TatC [Candidatus Saccharibacteria bacterium]MBI3338189.1 twin-arginine translocase subunit TatC [Candidatus Saccharibacteria bacterium]
MTRNQRNQRKLSTKTSPKVLPFIEHIHELRRRLFIVAASVVGFSVVGYFINEQLIQILLKPAGNQQFIYTSPGGAINFIFQICIYFGVAASIPIIVSQLLGFIEPVLRNSSKKFLVLNGLFSIILAASGMTFGYFVGLPAAMHFLTSQFTVSRIEALLTIQEYMSFVTIYLVGSALLFQIPLIMTTINRIKPLKPSGLFKIERFVIVGAFVLAAIITPTPDVFNQLLVAGPIIAIYHLGILLIWLQNRQTSSTRIMKLLENDAKVQAERLAHIATLGSPKIVRSQSELSRAKTVLSEGEVAVATSREEKLFVFDSEVSPQAQTRRVADRIRSGDGGVLGESSTLGSPKIVRPQANLSQSREILPIPSQRRRLVYIDGFQARQV